MTPGERRHACSPLADGAAGSGLPVRGHGRRVCAGSRERPASPVAACRLGLSTFPGIARRPGSRGAAARPARRPNGLRAGVPRPPLLAAGGGIGTGERIKRRERDPARRPFRALGRQPHMGKDEKAGKRCLAFPHPSAFGGSAPAKRHGAEAAAYNPYGSYCQWKGAGCAGYPLSILPRRGRWQARGA